MLPPISLPHSAGRPLAALRRCAMAAAAWPNWVYQRIQAAFIPLTAGSPGSAGSARAVSAATARRLRQGLRRLRLPRCRPGDKGNENGRAQGGGLIQCRDGRGAALGRREECSTALRVA